METGIMGYPVFITLSRPRYFYRNLCGELVF
jgi:hypothetical protein